MVQSSHLALFPLCERVIKCALFDVAQVSESVVIDCIIILR